jgi:hypothetical protein
VNSKAWGKKNTMIGAVSQECGDNSDAISSRLGNTTIYSSTTRKDIYTPDF